MFSGKVSPRKKYSSNEQLHVPNQIEDNEEENGGGRSSAPILRNSVLEASFRTPKSSGHQVIIKITFCIIFYSFLHEYQYSVFN